MKENEILSGEPINGHIVIKVDLTQIKKRLGMSEDSKIELPESYQNQLSVASDRGEVVKMSVDAFGKKYVERYGNEVKPPQVGDIVHFVPYQSARLDKEGKYYIVTDDSIKFIERCSDNSEL